MSGEVQKAESIAILAAVGVALFVGYKVYKAGSKVGDAAASVVDSVTGAANAAASVVVNGAAKARSAVQNAYAEIATVVTGQQHYSPDALAGSMSRADAIALAEGLAENDRVQESQEYRDMVMQENYSLLRRYPANEGTDPSLPYIGYRS